MDLQKTYYIRLGTFDIVVYEKKAILVASLLGFRSGVSGVMIWIYQESGRRLDHGAAIFIMNESTDEVIADFR